MKATTDRPKMTPEQAKRFERTSITHWLEAHGCHHTQHGNAQGRPSSTWGYDQTNASFWRVEPVSVSHYA